MPKMGSGEGGWAEEQARALLRAERAQERCEELAHDSVAKLLLHLRTARLQHGEAIGRGALAERAEQRRLADPGRSLDQNGGAVATVLHRVEDLVERRQFSLTLDEVL